MDDPAAPDIQHLELPKEVPVMVLDGCYLFPGCFLPLFIFEDRYRKMLAHALDGPRMFCVGSRLPSEGQTERVHHISTVGLIRASVKQDDGTSHVMLYGLQRVRFTGWKQEAPFRIATIEAETTAEGDDPQRLSAQRAEAIELLPAPTAQCAESMRVLRETLDEIDDPERVCDILSYHFVRTDSALCGLLSERSVESRYRILLRELTKLRKMAG